ncbi:MAG: acetyl-CoA carboxylase biotin carboxylase subunit [Candidatus Limnocylindria bacterium]
MSLRTDRDRPPFKRLLIANRGEIAVRVIRACREMGISPVAVHSDADVDALHVRLADASERIGPPSPAESYLSIEAIIEAARRSGAEAIHPGYGFLSENAEFAGAVIEAGLVFVGPPAATLASLGNKLAARRGADAAGVPIVPGTTVAVNDELSGLADIGFPLMLKAAAGGGGRGMRRVDSAEEVEGALAAARREAISAFGDGTVYAERLLAPARHVEVQLLGDRHGGLAVLGERDCSVQRRHQKLVEETPAPAVDSDTRAALFDSARRVAGTVEFHNAATVEFLLDADRRHYFLEMNTRLQVEHGVTEMATGIDLVAWQIRVAAGDRLPDEILTPEPRGHAIEVRLYAEDPYADFRPSGGRITAWRLPEGPGIRVDAGVECDMELRSEYDPLLAKLMVHAEDRPAAVDRLRRALDELMIGGVQTDAGFLRWLVDHPAFIDGEYDTGFIGDHWPAGQQLGAEVATLAAAAASAMRSLERAPTERQRAAAGGSAWGRAGRLEARRG